MATMAGAEPSAKEMRLVISASSLGTIFEWYDFFIWGTLATTGILGRTFLPPGNETLANLMTWLAFAVGFGFRPLGAILFGYLGDRLGRKYTFLVTITVMGLATAGIGLVPSYAAAGIAAPILILVMRVAQGLALGGEYGGAAIYVAEHSPGGRSGFHTSFIQASVVGGFILSLIVVLGFKTGLAGVWDAWGWRAPFLFSIVLLAVSLWMRLKLSESPVFKAMKEAGETAKNPFVESFTYPGNGRRLFVALFGIAAGLTVIWYTAMFSVLSFLQGPMHIEATAAQLITGAAATGGLFFFIFFGALSDRVGRKKPIVIGYALTLVLLIPMFWVIGNAANPGWPRRRSARRWSFRGRAVPMTCSPPSRRTSAGSCSTISRRRAWPIPRARHRRSTSPWAVRAWRIPARLGSMLPCRRQAIISRRRPRRRATSRSSSRRSWR